MAHLRTKESGNFDQAILNHIKTIAAITFLENLAAGLELPLGGNLAQRRQIRCWQLGKQFAGFKLDHAANLNDRGSQEQARMQVKSEADPKSEKDGHPKRHPHNPPMSAVDSRINQETVHCARTRSDDYRRAPPAPPHGTVESVALEAKEESSITHWISDIITSS